MTRWLLIVAGIALLAPMFAWGNTLEQVGSVLWKMTEIHTGYRDHIIKSRELTTDKVLPVARSTAHKLTGHRNKLAELAPKLDPAAALTVPLQQFLAQWPDEESFLQDLLANNLSGEKSGAAITSLALKAPDKRWSWKTLFPLFRP